DLEHAHHAVLAGRGQAPALEPAEGDHVGAEGDGFEDVATALHAAIEHDAGAALHGLHDLRQRVHAADAVIDLPAAMVGHPDHIHAMLHRQRRVFRGLDALQHEGAAPEAPDLV